MPEQRLMAVLADWGLGKVRYRRLAGDVSPRRYYRLWGDGLADGATAVAMVAPLEERRKLLDWLAIRAWLVRHGVPVPAVRRRDTQRCVLLLEDVGDALLTAVPDAAAADAWYRATLEHLARLERTAAAEGPAASPAHGRRLEELRIRWELRRFRKVVAAPVADLDDRELELWKDGEDAMVAALEAVPRVWMHRDLHARNLLVHSGHAVWIDFQDAMMGPWLYDLASLLFDPYVGLPADRRGALLEFYLTLPQPAHVPLPAARALLDLATVQRLVHCVACYVWVAEHFGNDLYLRYLPFAAEQLEAALERCDEAAPLARVMASRWGRVRERWSCDAVPG